MALNLRQNLLRLLGSDDYIPDCRKIFDWDCRSPWPRYRPAQPADGRKQTIPSVMS